MFFPRKPSIDPVRLEKAVQASGAKVVPFVRPPREKRQEKRLPTWQRCILHDKRSCRIDGVLMNYTEKGAHVRFRTRETPPQDVILTVPSLGINRPARIVWSERGDIGLVFL